MRLAGKLQIYLIVDEIVNLMLLKSSFTLSDLETLLLRKYL